MRTTGHIVEKRGKWYAVINLYDTDGKRHEKWKSLDLEAKKGSKTEATYRLNQLLAKYNSGELYLHEGMSRADMERERLANLKIGEYLDEWLELHKGNVSANTYDSYRMYIDHHMKPFFDKLGIAVKELTGDEVNEYYAHLREKGLKGTTCQRHHSLLLF